MAIRTIPPTNTPDKELAAFAWKLTADLKQFVYTDFGATNSNLEKLPVIGNPWQKEFAKLAAPIAMNS